MKYLQISAFLRLTAVHDLPNPQAQKTSSTALSTFLETRASHLASAYESASVPTILTFSDPELSFSDHGARLSPLPSQATNPS